MKIQASKVSASNNTGYNVDRDELCQKLEEALLIMEDMSDNNFTMLSEEVGPDLFDNVREAVYTLRRQM